MDVLERPEEGVGPVYHPVNAIMGLGILIKPDGVRKQLVG